MKATIFLANDDIMADLHFAADVAAMAKAQITNYGRKFDIEVEAADAEGACEEAFDISNNPGRREERAAVFGHSRSVSVGDVVEVEGTKYVCASVGWVAI